MKRPVAKSSGPRSEVSILLPAAMVLLVVLSSFALFSYRSTLALLVEERKVEAETIARRLAVMFAQAGWTSAENLKQQVPGIRRVVVLDGSGWPVLGGPDAEAVDPDTIVGEAPFRVGKTNYRMRVELPALVLLARQRSLEVLTPWILALDAAILLLVFLSMRRLLVPLDRLIERAREFSGPGEDTQKTVPVSANEVGFLADTFDRAVGEIADLTEAYRRSREDQLAESLTRLGELSAGVAHEMRNSIATIKGYLELASRDPQRELLEEYLGELRRESEHLHRVLEDFLSFARPGSVRLAEVDLRSVLVRALEDPALGGQKSRLASSEEGKGDGWIVAGDAQLLERALRNLLANAAAAQKRAGRQNENLEVSLARRGDRIELALRDHGEGIPPELLPRIFEPFVTGHPKGVGLGLALTRKIVLLHEGSVELEAAPGGGTVARLVLPSSKKSGETAT